MPPRFLSVFDMFKVGVGPSSSHTVGPMIAAGRFLDALRAGADRIPGSGAPARVGCRLHGSLAYTGKGHATDRAVILGLAGFEPASFDAGRAAEALAQIAATGVVAPPDLPELAFEPERDVVFDYGPALPGHANGMVLSAWDAGGNLHMRETYYSIGGGFVLTARELDFRRGAKTGRRSPTPRVRRPSSWRRPRRTGSASPACSGRTS
jgi:L-serine dehydratase